MRALAAAMLCAGVVSAGVTVPLATSASSSVKNAKNASAALDEGNKGGH